MMNFITDKPGRRAQWVHCLYIWGETPVLNAKPWEITTDIMFLTSLNKLNRPSNHTTDTSLHFRDLTDHQSLTGKRKRRGKREVAASLWWILLQKQALFLEQFGPEGWSASSLMLTVSVLLKQSEIKRTSRLLPLYVQHVSQSTHHEMFSKK